MNDLRVTMCMKNTKSLSPDIEVLLVNNRLALFTNTFRGLIIPRLECSEAYGKSGVQYSLFANKYLNHPPYLQYLDLPSKPEASHTNKYSTNSSNQT